MYNQIPLPPAIAPFAPYIPFILILDVILKGFALWKAAKNDQRNWFIAILFLNTLGLLPLIYLLIYRKKS